MDNSTQQAHQLGDTVVRYALRSFFITMSIAATWSCSTILGGLFMALAMAALSYVLYQLSLLAINMLVPDNAVISVGTFVGSAAARFTSLFSRKAVTA